MYAPNKSYGRTFYLSVLLMLLALATPSHAAGSTKAKIQCEDATLLSFTETIRSGGLAVGTAQIIELRIDSPALVLLDVRAQYPTLTLPKLTFLGRHCATRTQEVIQDSSLSIHRTATTHTLLLTEPGRYYARVAAQDPEQALGRYSLIARQSSVPSAAITRTKTDPDSDESDQAEIEPDRFVALPILADLEEALSSLCEHGSLYNQSDDHDDSTACATPLRLGEKASGEIRNGWGDDADVFTFVLEQAATVKIETHGETDTYGRLYSPLGYRLVTGDDSGEAGNFRQVMTLMPGRYNVMVEGRHGAEGPYSILVEILDD